MKSCIYIKYIHIYIFTSPQLRTLQTTIPLSLRSLFPLHSLGSVKGTADLQALEDEAMFGRTWGNRIQVAIQNKSTNMFHYIVGLQETNNYMGSCPGYCLKRNMLVINKQPMMHTFQNMQKVKVEGPERRYRIFSSGFTHPRVYLSKNVRRLEHTPNNPRRQLLKESLDSCVGKGNRGVFPRCVETTLQLSTL